MPSTFADALVNIPENKFLDEMDQRLPWLTVEKLLNDTLPNPGGGRPPIPFIRLFKMYLLSLWYGISDAQTEFQCRDRLSFRKFLGLSLTDAIPDATTLCLFREKLVEHQILKRLLEKIEFALLKQGLLARKGTLVDATFMAAANPKVDDDAECGHKGLGYTASVSVDRETGIIRKTETTSARVHDSQSLEAVLPEDPGKVYADLGYHGKPCRQVITQAGGTACIGDKKPKDGELAPWQKGRNAIFARIRSGVEHVFAGWKCRFGAKSVRYRGKQKAGALVDGLAVAYNFARLGFLQRVGRVRRLVWA